MNLTLSSLFGWNLINLPLLHYRLHLDPTPIIIFCSIGYTWSHKSSSITFWIIFIGLSTHKSPPPSVERGPLSHIRIIRVQETSWSTTSSLFLWNSKILNTHPHLSTLRKNPLSLPSVNKPISSVIPCLICSESPLRISWQFLFVKLRIPTRKNGT